MAHILLLCFLSFAYAGELISNLATPVYDSTTCAANGANCQQRVSHTVTVRFSESDTQTTLALLGVPGTTGQSILNIELTQPVTAVFAMGLPAAYIPHRVNLMVTQVCAAPNAVNVSQFQIGPNSSPGRRLLSIGSLTAKVSSPTIISTVLSAIPFACTFFSCDDGGANQQQLDAVMSSLDVFTTTQAQWNSNQSQWNSLVAQQLVRNTATFTAVQAQLTQQQIQNIALVNQTTMLATAIRLLNEQTDLRFALDTAEVDALQMETSALASAVNSVNTATQTQIKNLQEQVRNLVRRLRNLIGTMIDVTTLKPRRKRLLEATYSVLQSLNTEYEAFFSISNLQGPDTAILTEMQIIDVYNSYFTYQESSVSDYYAVQTADTLLCNVSFILGTNQAQSSWLDLLENIGYPGCLVNQSCVCYITTSATTAFIGFAGQPPPFLVPPYPYAFIYNPSLQCGGTLNRCYNPNTGVTSPINTYQDAFNMNPTAPYSVSWGVGAYVVADTDEAAAEDMNTILSQKPTTFNGLLRKRCNQMLSGQIVNGFQIPGQVLHDFSVPGVFNYGYNQVDPNTGTFITNNQYPVIRLSSNLLYSFQDIGAPADADVCAFNGDSLGFSNEAASGIQTYYSAYLNTLMNSFNTYVNIEYQSLQATAYGQVLPDLVCEFSMFQQNGNLDSYGCDTCFWLATSHASDYLPIHMLSQVALTALVQTSITDLNGNPLEPVFNTTDVTIVTQFPISTSTLMIGSTIWTAPGSVVYDFSPSAISIDSNAQARSGRLGYLAMPPATYEQYKTGLYPPLALWVENFGPIFDPRAGSVQPFDYQENLSAFAIGQPQVCTGNSQAVDGLCLTLQNWRFVCAEEDADFVTFVNYGGYDVIVTTQIPDGQIALIQTSYCPQDFTSVLPSSSGNFGGLMLTNPTNVENVIYMNIASPPPPDGCGPTFNQQVSVPANGTTFLFFPACGHQVVSFSLTDGTNTLCSGTWAFDLNLPGPFTPGTLPINVNVTLQFTQDTTANSLLSQSNVLTLLILQMYDIALLGPSASTLDTIAGIVNSSVIANLQAAANISSNVFQNDITAPLVNAVLNLSVSIDASLQKEAQAAAVVFTLQNQSMFANQAIIAQTNVIANLTTVQNANAAALNAAIQAFLDSSGGSGSSCGFFDFSSFGCIITTILHVILVVGGIIFFGVMAYFLYGCYQKIQRKKKESDSENREAEAEAQISKVRKEAAITQQQHQIEHAQEQAEADEERAKIKRTIADGKLAAEAAALQASAAQAAATNSSSTTTVTKHGTTTVTNNNNNNGRRSHVPAATAAPVPPQTAFGAEGGGRGDNDDVVLRLRGVNSQLDDGGHGTFDDAQIVDVDSDGIGYLQLEE